MVKNERCRFAVAVLAILLPLEIAACAVATETIGTVNGCYLFFACVAFNAVACFFAVVWFWRWMIAIISFGLVIIWWQVNLAFRMDRMASEAANIVSWAYSERVKTGAYPEALESGYTFLCSDCKGDITYTNLKSSDSFELTYHIASKSSYHWFRSSVSSWGYCDD
jgi:hypothetical protein